MNFQGMLKTLETILSGLTVVTTRFPVTEQINALNAAQNRVYEDSLTWQDDTLDLDADVEGDGADDDMVITPLTASYPTALTSSSTSCALPAYAHMAVCYAAATLLSEKAGDDPPGRHLKDADRLEAKYQLHLARAKRTRYRLSTGRPVHVEDAADPDRWDRQEW